MRILILAFHLTIGPNIKGEPLELIVRQVLGWVEIDQLGDTEFPPA